MRIAVFGGSFDPVHLGHLAVADAVQAQRRPDQLLWVPARQPPHKPGARLASGEDRVALLELAIAGRGDERVCRWELDRDGPSYTVDTLEALHQDQPGAELLLVLGGDSQQHWAGWRRLDRILELASPLWIPRRGWERLRPGVPGRMLEMERVDLSATELRQALAAGRSCEGSLPPAVEAEIRRRGLYRA